VIRKENILLLRHKKEIIVFVLFAQVAIKNIWEYTIINLVQKEIV